MSTTSEKSRDHNAHAADVLRRLDALGAINLGVIVEKSAEIAAATGSVSDFDDDPGSKMCYPNYIHIGPRRDFDLVTIASQVKELGFELVPIEIKKPGV